MKDLNDQDAAEMEQIEAAVKALGLLIDEKRLRALAIMGGRVARIRGNRFRIETCKAYAGGGGYRLFFEGPRIKANGERWATAREAVPLRQMEYIEPVAKDDQ